jgi:hypothetical protein
MTQDELPHEPPALRPPPGSVDGLCAASATIFAVGIAFLGYWGFLDPPPWSVMDLLVIAFALGGFAALGLVTWIATKPAVEGDFRHVAAARRAFGSGVIALWLAVLVSLLGSHGR